jgi:CBS domain-containing protein
MKVRDVMTKDVLTVEPGTPLKDVARLLVEHRISGLPVVAGDAVIGVVSEGDLLFKERGPSERKGVLGWLLDPYGMEGQLKLEALDASDAMTIPPVTIESRRPLAAAAALMLEKKVNRLPVVDEGKLVGIVTRADLVRAFARSDAEIKHEIEHDVLTRSLWLEPSEIAVTVADGEVRLDGRVDRRTEAEVAEVLVGKVAGVVSVDSRLAWSEDDGGVG